MGGNISAIYFRKKKLPGRMLIWLAEAGEWRCLLWRIYILCKELRIIAISKVLVKVSGLMLKRSGSSSDGALGKSLMRRTQSGINTTLVTTVRVLSFIRAAVKMSGPLMTFPVTQRGLLCASKGPK